MPNDSRKIISIVVPCRDSAKFIGPLIDQLRRLEVPPGWEAEIVVGYQASRDNTLGILKEKGVAIADSRDTGSGPCRNAAVRRTRGSLLVFMDSDARPADNGLLVRVVRRAAELGAFGSLGGPILLEPSQARNPIAVADHFVCWFNWSPKRPSGATDLFQPTTFVVMQRQGFERVGGFDPDHRILHDFDIQERLQAAGLPLYFDHTLRVFHFARDTMRASLEHSWRWGRPFREVYIKRKQPDSWLLVNNDRLFWINLPLIYLRRLRYVLRQSLKVSAWKTLYSLPFILLTLLAWAAGVAFGKGQPIEESGGTDGSPRHAV